ncbi:F-box protein At5g07670-like [Glycine soja]|uniref:F-box protein n=1 Tax=Glycine soja TaxID=3848 RepID=A0A445KZE7_GLYSO|nr:F-box protein At5g07670-like [Glycine soja]RZC16193.1 F-box protein [Glycine soja]
MPNKQQNPKNTNATNTTLLNSSCLLPIGNAKLLNNTTTITKTLFYSVETMSFHPNPSLTPPPATPALKPWLNTTATTEPLNPMVLAMHLSDPKSKTLIPNSTLIIMDRTLLLSDELLLRILSKLPNSQQQRNSNSLVCKRWLNLQGRLVRTLRVLDWNFVLSGRLIIRFPNLNHVDLVPGSFTSSVYSSIVVSHRLVSMHVDSAWRIGVEKNLLPGETVDAGLKSLAGGCPNLRKLEVAGCSEAGISTIGAECVTLQELELQRCDDAVLGGVAGCENLQILKIVGCVRGFYESVVSDIGLTILAQGCRRLVKLELVGCEGSFDGVKAIGQCCVMLEELVIVDHRMDDGWLAGVSFCENLKTLRVQSCKVIDGSPGLEEHLGCCEALERVHLQKFQMRDRNGVGALFSVCRNAREIVLQDCWGLDDGTLSLAVVCRRVKLFYVEGCSLLTTEGLESVIEHWKELECLRVVSCKNIKDSDISPELATLFSTLKELKWRPDTKYLFPSDVGVSMGKKGGKFFKRS